MSESLEVALRRVLEPLIHEMVRQVLTVQRALAGIAAAQPASPSPPSLAPVVVPEAPPRARLSEPRATVPQAKAPPAGPQRVRRFDAARDAEVRRLWAEVPAVSAKEIAARVSRLSPKLGEVSPQNVYNAVQRMGLPARSPSGSVAATVVAPAARGPDSKADATVVELPKSGPSTATPLPHAKQCTWPMGEPRIAGRRNPNFRYCEADTEPGQSFCPMHRALGKVKPLKPITIGVREGARPGPRRAAEFTGFHPDDRAVQQ